MSKYRVLMPLMVVTMFSGGLVLAGCDENKSQGATAPQQIPEVGVVTLKGAPLKMTTELPGRTSSYRVAEVRPQVSGIILKRNFVEGSNVKAGESLYQIDPANYQAVYDSAKGDLAQAEANAQIAALKVKRYNPLLGTQFISQQDYDQAVATQHQTAAAKLAAKANVESASINLAYTKVISPISGRIGKSAFTEGALVQNGQTTALATVQQLNPIYVDVTQSSDDFLRLRQELESGRLKQDNGKASVTLMMQNGTEYDHTGTLEFSDVTVDETTGSITLRALFPNPDQRLLPGMFVRARLDEGINPDALLVPQQSVTRTPTGEATAMVVNQDNKVELRKLITEQAIEDKWLVSAGLQAGDRVIVTGLQRAKLGTQVTAQEVNNNDIKKLPQPAESPDHK